MAIFLWPEAPHPDEEASSGLSPYLHFGHISAHGVFLQITRQDDWAIDRPADKAHGDREGWWGARGTVEASRIMIEL